MNFMEKLSKYSKSNAPATPQIPEGTHTGKLTNAFFRKFDEKKGAPTIDLTVVITDEKGDIVGRTSNNFTMTDSLGQFNWRAVAMILNAVGEEKVEDICAMSSLTPEQYMQEGNVFGFEGEQLEMANCLMDFCSGLNALSKASLAGAPDIDFIIKAGDMLTADGAKRNNLVLWGYRNSPGIRPAGTFAKKHEQAETIRAAYKQRSIVKASKQAADLAKKVEEALKE